MLKLADFALQEQPEDNLMVDFQFNGQSKKSNDNIFGYVIPFRGKSSSKINLLGNGLTQAIRGSKSWGHNSGKLGAEERGIERIVFSNWRGILKAVF